jgi:hypothetical protein
MCSASVDESVWLAIKLILPISVMCYECSRGSNNKKETLLEYYFDYDNDESAQRAIKHIHESCGSNTTVLGKIYLT